MIATELGGADHFVHCDVTSEVEVDAAVEAAAGYGRFSICVHCDGGGIAARTITRAGTPRDLDAARIRVNTIAPGTIETPPMLMAPESMRDAFAADVPFPKRLGRPDEYAALAEHMIENSYLKGQVIRLDGAVRFQPK